MEVVNNFKVYLESPNDKVVNVDGDIITLRNADGSFNIYICLTKDQESSEEQREKAKNKAKEYNALHVFDAFWDYNGENKPHFIKVP